MRVAWSGGGVRAVRVPGAGGPVPRGRRVPRLPAPQVQGQDYLNIKYFKTNLSMLILTNRYSFSLLIGLEMIIIVEQKNVSKINV